MTLDWKGLKLFGTQFFAHLFLFHVKAYYKVENSGKSFYDFRSCGFKLMGS